MSQIPGILNASLEDAEFLTISGFVLFCLPPSWFDVPEPNLTSLCPESNTTLELILQRCNFPALCLQLLLIYQDDFASWKMFESFIKLCMWNMEIWGSPGLTKTCSASPSVLLSSWWGPRHMPAVSSVEKDCSFDTCAFSSLTLGPYHFRLLCEISRKWYPGLKAAVF